jgi:hypothetical protein
MSYEIAIFEYSDLYDGDEDVSPDKVICEFMAYYKVHFNPRYYQEENVRFQRGRTWVSYADKSGGDKPMTIMLVGSITEELVANLKWAVAKLYIVNCEDCGVVVPKDPRHNWLICRDCRTKM